MLDSDTVFWCGLAARGAAWCGVGRRGAAGVHGRASSMRMCDCASGSARRAGVRTYFIIIIVLITIIIIVFVFLVRNGRMEMW